MNIPFVTVIIYVIICGQNSKAIINGTRVNKRYMVYLLSPASTHQPSPNDWLCGGAIINTNHIITSNACIYHIWKSIWVIAGYNKYVDLKTIGIDQCTSRFKKSLKRIYSVAKYPHFKTYNWDFNRWWFYTDVCIAQVNTPYNFNDVSYLKYCTYIPNAIKLTFRPETNQAGVDAAVFGWGSSKYYRPQSSSVNLNQPYLLGTTVTINDLRACRKLEIKLGHEETDWYGRRSVCSLSDGNVDFDGTYVGSRFPENKSVVPGYKKIDTLFYDKNYMKTIKPNGICQNDQGGPLVSWMGGVEYLIGIASTYFVKKENMQCVGPFKYTSIYLTGRYLNCSLSSIVLSRRSNLGGCKFSTVLERNNDSISQTHEPYSTKIYQDWNQEYWVRP